MFAEILNIELYINRYFWKREVDIGKVDLHMSRITDINFGRKDNIHIVIFRQHAASIYGFVRLFSSFSSFRQKKFRPHLSMVGG